RFRVCWASGDQSWAIRKQELKQRKEALEAKVGLGDFRLDEGDHVDGRIRTRQTTKFLNAGGARDVDLDELASDQVQADEVQSSLCQTRCHVPHHGVLDVGELACFDAASDVDVGADVVFSRHAP